MSRKIKICILFFFLPIIAFAQKGVDGKLIFKMWLFLDHNNNVSRSLKNGEKDSSIFNLFLNDMDLKVDTLKSEGFSPDYVFLNLRFTDGSSKNTIEYSDTSKYLDRIAIPANCEGYTLCINKVSGTSFRLKGFSGNDLLWLFKEVNDTTSDSYIVRNVKPERKENILKFWSIEGIDMKCIYNAIINGIESPCIKHCEFTKMRVGSRSKY